MDMFDIFEEEENKDEAPKIRRHLDIETQRGADQVGWDNKDLMYTSVAVVYCEPEEEFRFYLEKDMDKLASDLKEAHEVVGYNLLGFDYEVLEHYFDPWDLPTVDMMLDIKDAMGAKRSKSLDNIAVASVGASKSADGLKALEWWKEHIKYKKLAEEAKEQGDIKLADKYETESKKYLRRIAAYCKGDVQVSKDVYWCNVKNKKLYYTNNNGRKTEINGVRWTIRKGKSDF